MAMLDMNVILPLVALGASTALLLYRLRARRRDKQPNITPEEKIGERRDIAALVVEYEPLRESQKSVSDRPQPEIPAVKAENKPADATEANQFPPEKVESASAADITQLETELMKTELTKVPEEEFHPAIEPAAEVVVGEMQDAAEGTRSPIPAQGAEHSGVGTTEVDCADVDEGSWPKEAKPRKEGEPVSPENRGGRSRGTVQKDQAAHRRERRVRTLKPEVVCWKREREWILAVELPDDFAESQNVTVVQDDKPLDKDEAAKGCWRLSQLHGEVVVRILEAENESPFKITLGDTGCLVFKLSGGDRNQGRHVKRPSSGSCLVVVPKDWKRDEALAGTPPYEPEDVCLSGYRAHFFEL
jgi:hypothetical protein